MSDPPATERQGTTGGPFLFRSHEITGHGVGKPQSLLIREQLDTWTFFERALGDSEPLK